MIMFYSDGESWKFKYVYEYAIMLPCDLNALNENDFLFALEWGFKWSKVWFYKRFYKSVS
jgi:hypothetical protein